MPSPANVQADNKRLLINTLVLYVRMACTMAVGFFTTRELLKALGVVDFGLINVIGSVVTMFSFLSGTMQATVSRYFSYELGKKDSRQLRRTFSLALLIFILIVTITVVLSETVGVWFLNNRLRISPERLASAQQFFQFAVVGFIFNVIAIPYSALIISHEDVKAYSWITAGESLARLAIVYLLYFNYFDRLAFYGALLSVVAALVFACYLLFCLAKYEESRALIYWERKLGLELLKFAAWNLWGALSGLFSSVFVNILLNNHFGAVVNAARGVALQGAAGVGNFVTNFLTAVRPRIFKYYAEGNCRAATELSMKASRIGYFLLLLFSLPVLFEMEFILSLWLGAATPEGAGLFMRLILVQRLIDIITYPFVTLAQATGRVALYQTVVGVLQWLTLPLSWLALRQGGPASSPFWIATGLSVAALLAQVFLIRRVVSSFSISAFVKEVIVPVIAVTTASAVIPAVAYGSLQAGVNQFGVVCVLSGISVVSGIFFLGLTEDERKAAMVYAASKLRRLRLAFFP
jgi:O-antigen/teichoic acid export membrane protein